MWSGEPPPSGQRNSITASSPPVVSGAALITPRAPRNQRASPSPDWRANGATGWVEVVLMVTLLSLHIDVLWKRNDTTLCEICQDWMHSNVRWNSHEAQVRAEAAGGRDGRDPAADHGGGRRA